jgi:energy-converting hydrogenase B subunit D
MIPLQAVTLALVAVGGLAVVLARDLVRQALLNGFFGLALVVLFLVFQAPDVALSAVAVGGAAAPLVLALAIARVHGRELDREK